MSQSSPYNQERVLELQEARELRVFLRTVGDLVRLQVLRELAQHGEMSVTELAHILHSSQPLLSWHLGVLKRIELVTVRKDGRLVWYSLNRQVLHAYRQRVDAWLEGKGKRVRAEEGETCLEM